MRRKKAPRERAVFGGTSEAAATAVIAKPAVLSISSMTSIVEGGAPLGKTKRVDSNATSNTKNEIGGYSVVQAESHDAATKIFGKDHPHLQMPGAWIEIVEIMPMPGM